MWRRRAMLGLGAGSALVAIARLSQLLEPAEPPPGKELDARFLDFLRATVPSADGYLYVLPGEFGTDTGTAPRLRYELYPRRYDDLRASVDEPATREQMRLSGLTWVVVPDARQYGDTAWLRQPRDWLQRVDFDADRYVLRATP